MFLPDHDLIYNNNTDPNSNDNPISDYLLPVILLTTLGGFLYCCCSGIKTKYYNTFIVNKGPNGDKTIIPIQINEEKPPAYNTIIFVREEK
jgi:hypothetical protein